MKLIRTAGVTSQTVFIEVLDSTSTIGAGLTGLTYLSGSLTAYYARTRSASAVISLITQTVTGAYSSGGFVEVDAAHLPGVYRLDIPNAALASATGVDSVAIVLRGATNMVDCRLEIDLGASEAVWDVLLTGASHNITSSAGKDLRSISAGLDAVIYPPSGTVTLVSATSNTATLDAGASAVAQVYQWDVLSILAGTGAGQSRIISNYTTGRVATVIPAWTTTPDNTSGFDITPTASVQVVSYIAGQDPATLVLDVAAASHNTAATIGADINLIGTNLSAAPPTAVQNAAAVWRDAVAGDFTVASSIGKSLYTAGNVPGAAGGLFIAGTNAATTVTTSFTTTFTGNLTGSAGSVTGLTTATIATAVWGTAVPGAFASGTAGNIIGNLEDAATLVTLVWDEPVPAAYAIGTAGYQIGRTIAGLGF